MATDRHAAGDGRLFTRAAWTLVATFAILRLVGACARYLQVDELQILHLAWLRSDGSVPGRDHVLPQFCLLVDLLEPAWRAFHGGLAVVWIARVLSWLASLGALASLWLLARRLFGERIALAAVLAASLFTDFHERSFEVRSDVYIVGCWLLAFALLCRGGRRAGFGAGLLAAVSLALNFKSFVVLPFLALAAVLPEETPAPGWRPSPDRLAGLLAGLVSGAGAYVAYLGARGDVALYAETLARNLRVSADPVSRFAPWQWLGQSFARNAPFYVLVVAGLLALPRARRDGARVGWIPPAAFSLAYLAANPTFYPYNFVDVGPFWSLLAGVALVALLDRARPFVAILALGGLAAFPLVRAAQLVRPTIGDQVAINRFATAVTAPGERVYDGSGVVLTRRGPRQWRLHSLMVPRYRRGEFTLEEELTRTPVRLFVPSYRTRWLAPSDQAFVRRAFPLFRGDLGVAGWVVTAGDWSGLEAPFTLLAPGTYALAGPSLPAGAEYLVDGEPYRGPLTLGAGAHQIEVRGVAEPPPFTLVVWSPPNLQAELDRLPSPLRLVFSFRD